MISVITPVYNGSEFIVETIESILRISIETEIEYIVVNDGSTDNTLQLLERYEEQITIISKPNGGESSAVNHGIRNASGELILVVSADDPLPNGEVFAGAEEYFAMHPSVVAWYPNWKIIDLDSNVLHDVEVDEYSDELLIGRFRCLPGPGTLFRKDAALQIGGRNEKWTFVGDYDFWLRLSRVGQLVKRNERVAQWRFHDQSTSIAKRGYAMACERIAVIEEFLNSNQVDPQLARQAKAHSYYYAARLSFFDKKVDGRKYLLNALKANRGKIKDGRFIVYLFIASLPFSRLLAKPMKPLLRRFGRALT